MRRYSQQALRANQTLDNAIKKLDELLGAQRSLARGLSSNADTISQGIAPQLVEINNQVVNLINVIMALKKDIAKKGLQLDREEERQERIRLQNARMQR